MRAQSALLAAALAYAKQGWPVLACHHPIADGRCSCGRSDCDDVGKHPRYHYDDLARGLHSATTDPLLIQRWWTRWPSANIAIATGPQAGLLVADSDHASLYRLPPTATVATARGLHAYFTLARATQDFAQPKVASQLATQWIQQHIRRAIQNQGRTIRIPVHICARRQVLHRVTQHFIRTHRPAPTLEEQAALIGVSIAQMRELLAATQPLASLDQAVCGTEEEPLPLGAVLAAPSDDWDADLIADEQRHALHAALAHLAERERTVLTLRYRIGEASDEQCCTLANVEHLLGITREAVRQMEAKALTKLRTSLAATGM